MHKFELMTMGRTILDVYANQVGCGLEETTSFSKYVGGCPANIAIGSARLGVRVAHIARIGEDHHGRFIRAQLEREGVDTSHVHTDPNRLTGVAFLGIRDHDTFPLLHYRLDCADMAVSPDDYDGAFIGSAKALLVSGSHVTTAAAAANILHAVGLARTAGTRVIFDIDYRPVFWSLVAKDLGESRYVGSDKATRATQQVLPHADLIVGTAEEICIAGGADNTLQALRVIRALSPAPIVMKRGPEGCIVFEGPIPARLEDGIIGSGFPVQVFNVVGAGDGFMSGFLSAWLRDKDWRECCLRGNASGALVVSRHGCSPASPTALELEWYLANATHEKRLYDNQTLENLHRWTTRRRRTAPALLIDCSPVLGGNEPCPADPAIFAGAIARVALEQKARGHRVGAIFQGPNTDDAILKIGNAIEWIVRSIDDPSSRALRFIDGKSAAVILKSWPQNQIVKCGVPAPHAGSIELRNERLRELQLAAQMWGHELALAPEGCTSAAEFEALVLELKQLEVEPDWWILPSAAAAAEVIGAQDVLARVNPWCAGIIVPSSAEIANAALTRLPWLMRWKVPRSITEEWASGRLAGAELHTRLDDLVSDAFNRMRGEEWP